MAIAPTGAIYKALSFDNVSSRTYGVYITGQAVYNAPTRDVEMISIPGRNGAFALDKGRFENIEVSYPAGIFADNETDFAEAISDFRNFLCSRNGYVRLSDEYNPNEYRMAIYKSGLEVTPAQLKAGEFEIVFDCKPQRWLTSGETAITVSSGNTVTNPTLFESSPLLEVTGYGAVNFNGYEISLENDTIGFVSLHEAVSNSSYSVRYDGSLVATGDTITINTRRATRFKTNVSTVSYTPTSATLTRTTANISGSYSYTATKDGRNFYFDIFYDGDDSFTYGSSTSTQDTFTLTINYTDSNNNTGTLTRSVTVTQRTTSSYVNLYATENTTGGIQIYGTSVSLGEITAVSTQTILGNPTYIDCDLGEAYKLVDNVPVSLNQYIDLGSDLPCLASGGNSITYSNTVTDVKVVPRWWKV